MDIAFSLLLLLLLLDRQLRFWTKLVFGNRFASPVNLLCPKRRRGLKSESSDSMQNGVESAVYYISLSSLFNTTFRIQCISSARSGKLGSSLSYGLARNRLIRVHLA